MEITVRHAEPDDYEAMHRIMSAPKVASGTLRAAASAALFVVRINGGPHPFVSPALFGNRGYVLAVLVGFLAMLANLSTLVLIPLLLIGEDGLLAGAVGLVLTPGAVAQALLSP